jgi:hypothetical protein
LDLRFSWNFSGSDLHFGWKLAVKRGISSVDDVRMIFSARSVLNIDRLEYRILQKARELILANRDRVCVVVYKTRDFYIIVLGKRDFPLEQIVSFMEGIAIN